MNLDTRVGIVNFNSLGTPNLTNNSTTGFTKVSFEPAFPEGSKVVVQAQVMTFNGADSPGIRIQKVTTSSFYIRMNELVGGKDSHTALSDGQHTTETIGWTAYAYS